MLLGFKKQFAPKLENGSKIHTFRRTRKVTPKIGEKIYPYTGLRTRNSQKILGDYTYTGSQSVRMTIRKCDNKRLFIINLVIDGKPISTPDLYFKVALNDGFEDIYKFCDYWLDGKNKVAFLGKVYHWTDFKY